MSSDNHIEKRLTEALGVSTGQAEASDFYEAFARVMGRRDIRVNYFIARGGLVNQIYINGPERKAKAMATWTLRSDYSQKMDVTVEGVDSALLCSLCDKLFWTIDGARADGNELAFEKLIRLSPP